MPIAADDLPGLGRDPASVRRRIEHAERLLEGLITVPLINRKIGLDVLLDALPGIGPVAATAMGGWMVWEARNLGMSKWQLARMAGNVGVDLALSAIPWVGAIPDFFFRSNSRNLRMINRHLDRHHPALATVDGTAKRGR
ncbi:DUF4112 domain-containing protein [Sphingomonas sp.]|uniref:DUF4112 domain-containing protein n=1 Tax=Sphingomonas sp. TaxID=28214 RepID=UPI003AFF81A0